MQSSDQSLTVQDKPIFLWFFGLVFAGVGLMVMFQPEAWLFGGIFFLVGGLIVVYTPLTTATLERSSGLLTLRSQAIIRRTVKEIPLGEIVDVVLQSSRTSRGGRTYRVAFVLQDGSEVPLTGYYSSGSAGKQRQADALRSFLALSTATESPASQALRSPEPDLNAASPGMRPAYALAQSGETSGVHWRLEKGTSGTFTTMRWVSEDFKYPDGFLALAQKHKTSLKLPGGLLSGLSEALFRGMLAQYGFNPAELPGFERAVPLRLNEPDLESTYATFAYPPEAQSLLQGAWVLTPLRRWAQRRPLQTVQPSEQVTQLVVVFSPQGTAAAMLGADTEDELRDLSDLGIDLVRALKV